MRIGIYGGSFNPIHKGHTHFAKCAIDVLSLDKVLFVVNSHPPHKDEQELVSELHRLNMCRLAVGGDTRLEVCDAEVKRGGISYTIDTIRKMKDDNPDDELFLLTGTDMFCSIEQWKDYRDILTLSCLVGAPRRTEDLGRMLNYQLSLEKDGYTTKILPLLPVEISSTEIRSGEETELDPKVLRYITQNGLYGHELKLHVNLDELTQKLRATISTKRFAHSLNVANEAIRLADKYDADKSICYIAGLLHDICKEMDKDLLLEMISRSDFVADEVFLVSGKVWHGYAAAVYVWEEFEIYNMGIIMAIRHHTTTSPSMGDIEKIIYIADLISDERSYDGVDEMRSKAYQNLDEALLEAVTFQLIDLLKKGIPILKTTVLAYNELTEKVNPL